jgi:RES domain-containing protein
LANAISTLWRISSYAELTGEGGRLYGARWHSAGHRIVYLAASPAGALIEILVHLEISQDDVPPAYQLLEISVPDPVAIENIEPQVRRHQAEWKLDLVYTRALGDEWLRSRRTALAKVPSVILPDTWNYLLNPDHPQATGFAIQKPTVAIYDPRLLPKLHR